MRGHILTVNFAFIFFPFESEPFSYLKFARKVARILKTISVDFFYDISTNQNKSKAVFCTDFFLALNL